MASLRKSPRSNNLPARVQAVIKQHVSTGDRVVIGLSGGVDSVVLLDVLHRLSRNLSFALAAVHVNHQLQRSAGEWARFCRAVCRTLKVPLKVVKVDVAPVASVEAAARTARYRAWRNVRTDFIALAHNMDDQAETVLLQLLRGSGVKGLSAMPLVRALDAQSSAADVASQWASPSGPSVRSGRSAVVLRPLLEVPRSEIEAYARRRKLKWIEDDSNANIAFDRNFVRLEVLPVIARRYPAYRTTLLRASQNAAEAARLLDELATNDAQFSAQGIKLEALRALPLARAKNVIRYFLAARGMLMPSSKRLTECVRQLRQSRALRFCIDLGAHELLRSGDEIRLVRKTSPAAPDFSRIWRGEASLRIRELGGTLVMKRCRAGGISIDKLDSDPVTVRLRRGGERLQPDARRPRRSLKNLLQEARIPSHERDRLPLLFSGNALVFVPGIGIDAAFHARSGERAIAPVWQAD